MRPRLLLAPFVLCLAVALAGCGADPEGSSGPTVTVGGATVTTTAQGSPPAGSQTTSTAPPDYNVELYDNSYDPTALVVPNFQKVVFTNKGTLSHTVTIVKQGDPAGSFLRDQPLQPNGSLDYNFPNDGTYTVYCRYHGTETSGMHMTITV